VILPPELMLVPIEVRDPTIADECQRVVATLINRWPSLAVTPAREGVESARRNATAREHFTEEVLRVAGAREPGPHTLTRVTDGMVADGGGCSKFLWRRDLWDDRYSIPLAGYEDIRQIEGEKPEGRSPRRTKRGYGASEYLSEVESAKKVGGPPFHWGAVDIRTVYPIPQGGRIGEVLEVSDRPVAPTFRRYRLGYDRGGNIVPQELAERVPIDEAQQAQTGDFYDPLTTRVRFLEHWDDVWCTYLVEGQNYAGQHTARIVDQWQHGYSRHPYFFAPGLFMGWWRNRKVGWSISESKRGLVEYRSYLMTIHAQQAARDTLPPVFAEIPDGAAPVRGTDGLPRTPDRYQLGMTYFGQPGEKRQPMTFPSVAASLKEQIALVTEAIDKLGTPRMDSNLGGVEASGFAINQVLAEARLRYDPLAQSLETMLEEITRFMWHLIRTKVKETVWVYATGKESGWRGMGPDDLRGDVRVEWKLDPTLPSAQLIESRYHVEQVKAGFESQDQAIEEQGRNPDEVRFGRSLDRMRNSEWYQKYEDAYVVSEIGRGDLLAQAQQAAEELASSGSLPPGAGQFLPSQTGNQQQGPTAQGGMGTPGIPDMSKLAISPNGQGAAGVPMQGSVPGGTPGAVVPTQSAAAGLVQPLTG